MQSTTCELLDICWSLSPAPATRGTTGNMATCDYICSVPLAANVAVATVVFERGPAWWVAGLAGAVVAAAWNYVTTSRAVW